MLKRAGTLCCNVIASISFLILSAATYADTIENAVVNCRVITDEAQRINCYDQIADGILAARKHKALDAPQVAEPASSPSVTAPSTNAATPAQAEQPAQTVAQIQEDKFGAEDLIRAEQESTAIPKSIESTITDIQRTSASKRYVLTLANGQIWRQKEKKRLSVKTGRWVKIKRMLFGAYSMEIEGAGYIKVERVR
ncbi:MAG: hypothetical protein AAF512_11470 [Pseudomonadota bacterium]